MRIRGAEANHTLVLLDGIEANDPTTGSFDFSNLSAEDIERIEVIRGPQSGIYGSNALAGVVNVITRAGRGPLTLSVGGEAGSFRTTAANARASAGGAKFSIALSYDDRSTRTFNNAPQGGEKDPTRIATFGARLAAQLADNVTFDATLRQVYKRADRDGFDGPDGALASAFDDASRFTNDVFLGGASLRWDMFGGQLIARLARHAQRDRPPRRGPHLRLHIE